MTIGFEVKGIPKGQPRPRAFSRNGMTRMYDPGTADGWKYAVMGAFQRMGQATIDAPVFVDIDFHMPRPKRMAKGPDDVRHTSKPDIDNLIKAVLDALTEAQAWTDDALVFGVAAEKWYALRGQEPGAVISITSTAK